MNTAGLGARRSALGGLAGAALVLVLWPGGWVIGLLSVLLGAWGVRQLAQGGRGRVFVGIRWLATGVGAVAAGVLIFALLNLLFGGAWT